MNRSAHPYIRPIFFLKLSLSVVFLWFGFLKLLGASPVSDVIADAYPFIANTPALFFLLSIFEIAVGIGILIPKFARISAWLIVAHLLAATAGVLLSPQAYVQGFPFLSVVGEFVVKNIVLIAGAFLVATRKE